MEDINANKYAFVGLLLHTSDQCLPNISVHWNSLSPEIPVEQVLVGDHTFIFLTISPSDSILSRGLETVLKYSIPLAVCTVLLNPLQWFGVNDSN